MNARVRLEADSPSQRERLRAALEAAGYDVRPAGDGAFEVLGTADVRPGQGDDGGDEGAGDTRDEVLTYLAHELRNPLGVLHTSLQLLDEARDDLDPQLYDLLLLAERASGRLAQIVGSLSDIRAAQLGRLCVVTAPHDLADALRQAVADTPALAGRVDARIPASCAAELDARRIRQVLDNLLGNAVRYGCPGTPIEVGLTVREGVSEVAVRDHGPGIPREREHELFGRFARLGDDRPGTGLGLFLSRAIARAHGGDLVHERPDGPGARFVLRLPLPG